MGILTIIFWLAVGALTGIFLFYKKRFSYWKDRGVHYIEPKIPFGNFQPSREVDFKEASHYLYAQRDKGPFVGAFLFAQPMIVATNLDFIQHILIKDFSSFHSRGAYVNEKEDPLSAHMFSLEGEKWKTLRTKLSPTFTSGKMKFMFPTIVDVADRFAQVLAEKVKSNAILEMREYLARFTTDVIGTCAFGIECNSLQSRSSEFRRYGQKAFGELAIGPLTQFFAFQYPDLARKLHIKLFKDDVTQFFIDTVRQTVDFREKNGVKRNDFMELLIRLKNGQSLDGENAGSLGGMTLEEMAAQTFVFFIAGFETSSTLMGFALYELALNQEIQDKVRDEINEVLAKNEGKLTYDCMKEMSYLDKVISETLRKYPPIFNLTRQSTKDYRVPNTDVVIEKGINIVIPAFEIHHDPEIYPDPETFDPERFSPEQIKNRHPQAFQGFGDGPRNCIGLRFGKMQSRVGLITVLKNCRFKPCSKTTIPMEYRPNTVTLTPKYGMHLQIEQV